MHSPACLQNNRLQVSRSQKGFTLIELMVVVAIIGILAAIVYPSYRAYVIKGKRNAAQSFMLDIANRQKQYLLDARTYSTTLANLGITTLPTEVSPNYTIDEPITVGTAPPSFTITARPIGGQASDGPLTLTDTGLKGPSGKW